VDGDGIETHRIIGIHTTPEDPCSTTGTFEPPGSGTTGIPGTSVVAGGPLIDIIIDRNRIANMGLCGIGPVGFFDLRRILEVISIQNLTITNNNILNTLLRPTAKINAFGAAEHTAGPTVQDVDATGQSTGASNFASVGSINAGSNNPYGAICVPAVENLTIRDNSVTNFGARPGTHANGIFVLNGEGVDISRNRIVESRDWSVTTVQRATGIDGLFGGIVLALVTPPATAGDASDVVSLYESTAAENIKPIYQPGMPALRIEENVVRVPLGQALIAIGFGPFAISNNHFTCGGVVRGTTDRPLAQTVLIANLGTSIEAAADVQWSSVYGVAKNQLADSNPYSFSSTATTARALATSKNGTVLFSNNICQLEARADRQRSITSLIILSLDHLSFTGNNCWVDAFGAAESNTNFDAYIDALLVGGTINVTANRFQESLSSVAVSGITIGVANITSQNISTYCLLVKGKTGLTVDSPNITLVGTVSPGFCDRLNF
jgi:hypothetical protein